MRKVRRPFVVVVALAVAAAAALTAHALTASGRPAAQAGRAAAHPAATHPAAGHAAMPRAPVVYAALGDSYASGVGSGDYTASSGSCDRSPLAYPALYAVASSATTSTSLSFAACGGATVRSMLSGQLSAVSARTTLVSITVGGNDMGFTPDITACLALRTTACKAVADLARLAGADVLIPVELAVAFAAVRAHAPHAKVVVLGYPHLFDTSVPGTCEWLGLTERQEVDAAVDDLDAALQTAARRSGFVFADVRPRFAGHEICDTDPWLHPFGSTWPVSESFHPTPAGQSRGYLPALEAAAG